MNRIRVALVGWVAVLSVLSVRAQENLWTPQHVAKLRVVTEAVISPDGTKVAYVLAVPRELPKEKDGGSWTELHVVDTKGTSTPFITGAVNVAQIGWTPDGKEIAFLTKREKDPTRSLYTIGVKGGEARKILEHATDIQSYSFNGDGSTVAFLAQEAPSKARKALQDQGFSQEIYEEDTPFVRVWTAVLDAGKPTMVKLDGSASELHFNPKENKIAVALAPSPGIDDHIMFRKVHIVDLKSGVATKLDNPGKLGQMGWSTDGKRLAIITGADKHDPKEGRLWVTDVDSKKWIDYAKSPTADDKHIEAFVWKSATQLLFVGAHGISSATGHASAAGGLSVSPGGGAWPIYGGMSISADGKSVAMPAHTPQHPPEVYIFDDFHAKPDAALPSKPRRLTDSNPWVKTMKFARQKSINYKSRDGLDLEGVLIYPLDHDASTRYPLVLHVHGGPEAHYSNGWITRYADLGQVAAAKGMASFYPNYRGSTGYGVEFSMKGQKEAGGKEFDDFIDGVDHLIKMGLVDEKKVGITGGSYGGYATAWGATVYSHRFAAGVMFVGISDWISCSGTTDIPQEMFLVHHRKWLWDDWDYFKKASPIAHLDKHKTPLLIMHGKNDPRVNPGQSLEFYRHLKVRNQAPVRLVLYPGEGHGNRRAASRLDYNLRLLQWMEHYLKGPGGAMPPLEIEYGLPAAVKTSSLGWDDRAPAVAAREPWLGRGCPCCIGW